MRRIRYLNIASGIETTIRPIPPEIYDGVMDFYAQLDAKTITCFDELACFYRKWEEYKSAGYADQLRAEIERRIAEAHPAPRAGLSSPKHHSAVMRPLRAAHRTARHAARLHHR